MRKAFLILAVILLAISFSYAAEYDNRIVFHDVGRNTTINLNMDFFPTKYRISWGKYSFEDGAYESRNWLGELGVSSCAHQIKFTVSTVTGRFISQSDPTKYRDFYVAIKPCYNNGGDKCLYRDPTDPTLPDVSGNDRVPTTKGTNSITFYSIPFATGEEISVGNNTTAKPNVLYYDLLLCMDYLSAEDYLHLAETDDYIGTIVISWKCTDPDCTDNHSGSAMLMLNGEYDPDNVKYSSAVVDPGTAFLTINPTSESGALDIKSMVEGSGQALVANLDINSMTSTSSWLDKVMVFVSSSDSSTTIGNDFSLLNLSNGNTIGYTIKVFDHDTGSWSGTPLGEYDGKDYWAGYDLSHDMCIDLSGLQQISASRKKLGTNNYQILFNGDVVLEIPASERSKVLEDPASYSGEYKTDIFFHIVYGK